jgi:hypothetical protein
VIDTLTVINQHVAGASQSLYVVLLEQYHCLEHAGTMIAGVETAVVVERILPVFVASSASTTHRAVMVTTQLSLATLEFVSNILQRLICCHNRT